jgi:hypothetical protein
MTSLCWWNSPTSTVLTWRLTACRTVAASRRPSRAALATRVPLPPILPPILPPPSSSPAMYPSSAACRVAWFPLARTPITQYHLRASVRGASCKRASVALGYTLSLQGRLPAKSGSRAAGSGRAPQATAPTPWLCPCDGRACGHCLPYRPEPGLRARLRHRQAMRNRGCRGH